MQQKPDESAAPVADRDYTYDNPCTVHCGDTGVTMHMGFADAGLLAGILMQSRQTMEVIARSPVLQQSMAAKQYLINTNALSTMFEAFARQMKEISDSLPPTPREQQVEDLVTSGVPRETAEMFAGEQWTADDVKRMAGKHGD